MPAADELPPDPAAVCRAFDLGRPTEPLEPVMGGLSHRMWRLTASRGRFAVKQINRDWSNPEYVAWYDRAFAVEQAAFAAGIPMPRPVPDPQTGRCLVELPAGAARPATVRVHEWLDGRPLIEADMQPETIAEAGAILVRIHALGLPADGRLADLLTVHGPEHWQGLDERTRRAGLAWSATLHEALPLIADLEALVVAGRADADGLIMTHRDADPKNFLLDGAGRLAIIDWDAASPWSTRLEIATAMLDWSGVHEHDPEPRRARAILAGYTGSSGRIDRAEPEMFAGFIHDTLNWLEYNVRRALGERLQSAADRDLAERETRTALSNLPRFARSLDAWTCLLQ